jgi:hypothetical protein
MVFRLADDDLPAALALPGAAMFEPMAGRKMTGWVRVPRGSSDHWHDLAQQAAATPLA